MRIIGCRRRRRRGVLRQRTRRERVLVIATIAPKQLWRLFKHRQARWVRRDRGARGRARARARQRARWRGCDRVRIRARIES